MPFDLFILGILLFTTIRGAAKGVAWQLAGIGALVLCFLFATPLSLAFAPMIKLAPPLNRWVAMLAIYLVFSFGTFSIARGFRGALEKAKFVEFDRHMGALFGLTKGAIIALVITFFAVAMSEKTREFVLTTYTGYAAAHIMDAIDPIMPKELHAILEPYIHELDAVDPDLERRREEHHHELGEPDSDELGPDPRRIGGYKPVTGNKSEPIEEGGDPFQNDADDSQLPGYSNRPRQPAAAEPTFAEEAQQLLESLPGLVQKVAPSIKQQILKAVENTLTEHREELVDQISKAKSEEQLSTIARTWKSGRPRRPVVDPMSDEGDPGLDLSAPFSRPRPTTRAPDRVQPPGLSEDVADVDLKPRRQELLQGIAQIFSSQPTQQAKKMTEIETALLGLPDPVAVGALEDWLSDLSGEGTDPDPETTVATQLNLRIAHQVDQQQVPHDRLTPEWQTRLERFLRN